MKTTFACTMRDRLKGLLGKSAFDGVLVLMPCCDIHTYGMKSPIDIAFVDMGGLVLESYRAVSPCRRLKCRGACAVLERFAASETWFSKGDAVSLEIEDERGGQ